MARDLIGTKQSFPASIRKIIGKEENWRASGDAARARKDWAEAATHYQRHLNSHPKDAAIWIQLGHALKESQRRAEAEEAYRTALRITPDDADLNLQLGHLLKIMGRTSEAAESYETSSRLKPTAAVVAELAALRTGPGARGQQAQPTIEVLGTGTVFLPIDDLFDYIHHHRTVSGIQRVQLNLVDYFSSVRFANENYTFVFSERNRELRAVAHDDMADIASAFANAQTDHDAIRRLIVTAKARAGTVQLRSIDTCFIVGSFWNPGGNPDLLSQIKQSRAKLGIYFHDLIPVTHREYVVSALSAGFAQALVEALSLVDFGFANSEYTAREVGNFVAREGLLPFPISPIRLAHAQAVPMSDEELDAEWLKFNGDLQGQLFVLCVGTIEARKNHRYLFDLWKALLAEGIEPPKLLLVGRQGWRVDDLMAQLEATQFLDGRIKLLHDVSDAGLATLYRHCLFTIFPSFVEGWGLPIGESLSHGKLCLASNTTSMREVGGDLVEYFDPWNLHSGIELLRRVLRNPSEITQREKAIKTKFKPRSWDDFGSELQAGIAKNGPAGGAVVPTFSPALASGSVFTPAEFSLSRAQKFSNSAQRQLRLILSSGWDVCEDFGTWMAGRTAHLRLRSDVSPGTDVTVYLHLALRIVDTHNELAIESGDGPPMIVVLPRTEARMTVRVPARVGTAGGISLTLRVSGPLHAPENDNRLIRVGLVSLCYAALSDSVARAEVLESLLIGSGVVMH